jgi:hypothetical protein
MADVDALTPQEQQFFDSRGELDTPEAAPAPDEAASAEPELVLEEAPSEPAHIEESPPEKHQTVPLPVLLEERNKGRALREQFEEERRKWAAAEARMQERLDIVVRAMTHEQQAKQPVPSFDDDPIAATVHGFQQTGDVVKALQAKLDRIEQGQQAEHFERQLTTAAVAAEHQFKTTTPDYDEAIKHLINARGSELSALGYQRQQAIEIMQAESKQLTTQSLQSGRNPAQVLYELAKVRGYAPKAQAPKAEQKMDTLESGNRAASGIDNVAGRQQKSVSLQSLIEMDDDEFYKISSSPKAFRRLFGET